MTLAQHSSACAAQLPRLRPHSPPQGTGPRYQPVPTPGYAIRFHIDAYYPIPLVSITRKLELDIQAWYWWKARRTMKADVEDLFRIDHLLVMLKGFKRDQGCSNNFEHDTFLLHNLCRQVLDDFQTPGIFRSRRYDERIYYRLRLALHYHRSDPIEVRFFEGGVEKKESAYMVG